MKKILLCLSALATTTLFATAQISLSEGDYPDTGDMNTYFEIYGNDIGDSITIGAGTANEIYDFSKLATVQHSDTNDMFHFVAPSTTGHAASHPGATLAYVAAMDTAGNDTTFIRWVFLSTDGDGAQSIGVTLEVDTAAVFNNNPPKGRQVILHATYDNPEIWVNSSFAVPYSVNSTSHFTVNILAFGIKHDETFFRSQNVNGYGKLIHPNFPNDSMDVLRVEQRYETWERDTVLGMEDDSNRDTTYMVQYWARGYGMPVAIAFTQSDYTTITGAWVLDVANLPVSVERINPADFELYPNPASTSVTIDFGKTLNKNYTLMVYNSLGQVVGTQTISAGSNSVTIDVSSLPKGTYYVTAEGDNGEKALTKKLVVY